MPKQQKEQTFWEIRYSDGHVFRMKSKMYPMGNASRHLHAERDKGRDHGAILSIRELPEEAMKELTPAKHHNGAQIVETMPATYEEFIKEEEIELPETIISPELDDELYKLIQAGIQNTELVEKLFYKFYEFTQEKDSIFDNIFLKEFCKRIYRGLNDVLQEVENIEKNLEGEN